jgi:hypothetical protein
MEITKLPTDNFYIFICFAGLAIILYFGNFLLKKFNALSLKVTEHEKYVVMLSSETDVIEKFVELSSKEIKLRTAKFHCSFNITYGDAKKEMENLKIPQKIIDNKSVDDYISQMLAIEKLLSDLESPLIDSKKKSEVFQFDIKKTKEDAVFLKKVILVTALIFLVSAFMTSYGLTNWYIKHQFYQDQMIKLNYENELKKSSK